MFGKTNCAEWQVNVLYGTTITSVYRQLRLHVSNANSHPEAVISLHQEVT